MSHLWQGFAPFFGRLSATSCLLFLFLCSSVASRVSLPTQFVWIFARLQPLQKSSEADWFVGCGPYHPVVFYSSPIFSHKFQRKGPRVGGGGRESLVNRARESIVLVSLRQVCPPRPCLSSPTKEFWPRIFPPLWRRYRFPALGRSTPGWGRCMERSCCWWRWVCGAGTERGVGGCRMAWSGGPDPVLGGAAQQKVEKGTPAGIQSCRKACQHAAQPEETRGNHMTVSTAC